MTMTNTTNTTLSDYGVEPREEAPRIQKEHHVTATTGQETAGWVGPVPGRGVYGFVRPAIRGTRASPEHWLFELDAYSVHETVLSKLASLGAQIMLVVETDTGRVLEWPMRAYDNELPKKYATEEGDQRYALCEHAKVWDDHANHVYIADHVDVSDGYQKSAEWWDQ